MMFTAYFRQYVDHVKYRTKKHVDMLTWSKTWYSFEVVFKTYVKLVTCKSRKCRSMFWESECQQYEEIGHVDNFCSALKILATLNKKCSPLMSAMRNCYKCCFIYEIFELWIAPFFPPPLQPSPATRAFQTTSLNIQYTWFKLKEIMSLSHFCQSAGNFVTSFENKLDNILSEHSLASFLCTSSNDFGLGLTPLSSWSKSPACRPTLLHQSVSWQLRSSPTDIKLHTNHPAIVKSSLQGFRPQAIWHPKLETLRFTSFHFHPKLSDMPAFTISFTEQPVGSQPHCPSMKHNCASTTVKTSTREVSANKWDFVSVTLFRELFPCSEGPG